MSDNRQSPPQTSDSDLVLDLVQQGLVLLPLTALLTARLVCKRWHTQTGCLLQSPVYLPFDAWALDPAAIPGHDSAESGDSSSGEEEEDECAGRKQSSRPAAADPAATEPDVTAGQAAALSPLPQVAAAAAAAGLSLLAAAPAAASPQAAEAARHPLQRLPGSFPRCSSVTLTCRNVPPAPEVLSASLQLLGQLPQLDCLTLRGTMSPGPWRLLAPALGGASPALQQRLARLELSGLDLPDPGLLEGLLGPAGLSALTSLHLLASMKSPALQTAHVEAVAAASQLQQLVLVFYQAAQPLLDSVVQLTRLRHLELSYKGIFPDTRPVFAEPAELSQLSLLTSLSSAGLASPLLPPPSLTVLQQLSITGLTKRLHHSAISGIAACTSLRELRLEAGRRGLAAVAAEQLHLLTPLQQLSSLVVAVSKGSLATSQASQQLLGLSALGGGRLRRLSLTADHRLAVSTPLLIGLAEQWTRLESLQLSKFGPQAGDGLAGLGALTSLTALSLRPGLGTGKLLQGLAEGLAPLERLQRLHVDFAGALRLDQVEAVAGACAGRLRHLSLNMRGASIGSKAMVAIAQLHSLTSLQLLSTMAVVLHGPATAALRTMTALRWLSVQAPEDTASQQPDELAKYVLEGVKGLASLQELRLWLGSGAAARQAAAVLLLQADRQALAGCECVLLNEPEKPRL